MMPETRISSSAIGDIFAALAAVAAETNHKSARKRRKPTGPRVTFYEFLDAVSDKHQVKRVEFPGGFHVEASYDDYVPLTDGPIRLTYTYATRVLTATRRPMPGQPEKPKRISLADGVKFVAELAKSVKDETPSEDPAECFCYACANPPCWFCETAEWCEDCGIGIAPDLWDDHLYKHENGLIADA